MKRRVAVVSCALLTIAASSTALAQSPYLGFKLGPTWSILDFSNNNEGNSWYTDFGASGFMRFEFSGFSLQPEIQLVTKGTRLDDTFGNAEVQLEYIEFPVGLMFTLGQDRFAPYIMIGPSFAFEADCAVKTNFFEERGFNCDEDLDPNLQRRQYDVGLFGSGGLHIRWGPGLIVLEGRYTYGLVNLRPERTPGAGEISVKNRSFLVFGGYSIGIGRR